jgi:Flp pilus assembly pilin Flp
LAEYCLITALIALCACGIFYKVSGGMQNLWTTANTTLAAERPASPTGSGSAPASSPSR